MGGLIYSGLVPGGETGWAMLTAANPEPGGIDVGMFRFLAHEDPAWDWRTFDVDRDVALIDKKASFIDATSPDLSAFRARGGKLLIYHGWNDGGSGERFRRRTPSITIPACWQEWDRSNRIGFGSSWCQAWRIAEAAQALTR